MKQISFKDYKLSEEILNAVTSLGYIIPTDVQQKTIPLVQNKSDLVVRSQTGSGKTAAYAIPICEMIDWLANKSQALVLTPTRELAVQVKEDVTNIGKLKRIKAIALYGGHSFSVEKTELKQKNHIAVGTPGRILDHIGRGTLTLDKIKYLVIDEADEMLNMGFIEQVEAIMKELPKDRITMLFSATFPERVKELANQFMKSPIYIETEDLNLTVDKIDHYQYQVSEEEKFSLLSNVIIMENPDSCIVFCNTKERVEEIHEKLSRLKHSCSRIHGGMEQEDRLKAMNAFKKGAYRYLIATDVAARGIDVENVSLIINYDFPLKKESYVHRTGRTGRAGLSGKAITFVTMREEYRMKEIAAYIGYEITKQNNPLMDEVAPFREAFESKLVSKPKLKRQRNEELNSQIMTLYFNGGKKKKLRATNFVGVIANIEGVAAEDIGVITIADTHTHIDIYNNKGRLVLKAMKDIAICGKKLKVHEAKENM